MEKEVVLVKFQSAGFSRSFYDYVSNYVFHIEATVLQYDSLLKVGKVGEDGLGLIWILMMMGCMCHNVNIIPIAIALDPTKVWMCLLKCKAFEDLINRLISCANLVCSVI